MYEFMYINFNEWRSTMYVCMYVCMYASMYVFYICMYTDRVVVSDGIFKLRFLHKEDMSHIQLPNLCFWNKMFKYFNTCIHTYIHTYMRRYIHTYTVNSLHVLNRTLPTEKIVSPPEKTWKQINVLGLYVCMYVCACLCIYVYVCTQIWLHV